MYNWAVTKKKLNKEQLRAVRYGKGPLIIIAGAGTGKTTVITERIKRLINQELAKPSEILALTFTDKAAREMEERVDQAMPYGYTQMWISTFHSFCDRILRDEAVHIGLDPSFVLMTQAEALIFLKSHLFDFRLNYFRPRGNPTKFLKGLLQHFNRLRDEDITPQDYLAYAKNLSAKLKIKNEKFKINPVEVKKILELARSFKKYQEFKIKENVMDFGDLINHTLRLFRQRPNILHQYQKRFKYLLVDEFQDTNISQYALIKALAPPSKKANLTVVGDDSQSIYKFRGAAVSNILQFKEEYKKAKQVILIKNYRSTQTILNHAYKLITHNNPDTLEVKLGINKNLKAARKIKESPILFIHTDRVENEAERTAKRIRSLKAQKNPEGVEYRWNDFAILVRANDHSHPFSQALAREGIPYQFLGPGRLLKQPEIKNLIAYLKILYNFEDNVAFFRVLTMDIFDLSARDLAAIRNFARKYNLSFFEACEETIPEESSKPKPRISQKTKEKLKKLIKMINKHLKLIPKETTGQILYYFLEETGLLKKLTESKTVIDERKSLNVSKFFDKLKAYEAEHEDVSIFPVVDWLNMKMAIGESPLAADVDWTEVNAVNILTVHSAKGLEFPIVFLVNLVNQRFPTTNRREQIPIPEELIKEILPSGDHHEQEERRLFYVGMTRAKDRLYLTAANYYGEGKREKKISPFVYEALGKIKGQGIKNKGQGKLSFDYKQAKKQPYPTYHTPYTISSLSYSQISVFNTCPLQYKYKYFLKIPIPLSMAQSFGSSIHRTLKDFYQMVLKKKKPKEKNLLNFLEKNWVPLGYASKIHEKKMLHRGKKMLKSFYQKAYDSKVNLLDLEKPFSFPLTNRLKIKGIIDRVDQLKNNQIEIIDYKTGKTKTQKEIDQDLQLTIYAMTAVDKGIYGKKPEDILLSFYFLDNQEKISTKRNSQQLKKAKQELIKKAKEIEKSDFPPTPSKLCDFCEYRLLCEEWK
ncbi:UvrD-helicase domain-containing protein [Candidatus Microgenomates bacterium]|nr:UvrD-helicase domain-containing protein [Candidatus Microgenomates bacterium]